MNLNQLPETRRAIVTAIKQHGPSSIADLAARLSVTPEGVRQHLVHLERDGWVERQVDRKARKRILGRPQSHYSLTTAGDQLFPKHYDLLAIEVIDTIAQQLGPGALENVLMSLTEARVREWEPRLRGMSVAERVAALKDIYGPEDRFTSIEPVEGGLRIVERNCPFYNIAMHRPALCSVTVSVLTRLLGVNVIREERFQNGDGRCAFRIFPDQPVEKASFFFEPPIQISVNQSS